METDRQTEITWRSFLPFRGREITWISVPPSRERERERERERDLPVDGFHPSKAGMGDYLGESLP